MAGVEPRSLDCDPALCLQITTVTVVALTQIISNLPKRFHYQSFPVDGGVVHSVILLKEVLDRSVRLLDGIEVQTIRWKISQNTPSAIDDLRNLPDMMHCVVICGKNSIQFWT